MEFTDTTTTPVFVAGYDYATENHGPVAWGARVYVETVSVAAAEAFVAAFPKNARLRSGTGPTEPGAPVPGYVSCWVELRPTATNGGVNETGVRRLRSIITKARKLGLDVAYGDPVEKVVDPMPSARFFDMVGVYPPS